MPARSVIDITGLVGVSTNSSFVRGVNARSTASRSDVSTYEKVSPVRSRTLSKSRKVPPYVLSVTMT